MSGSDEANKTQIIVAIISLVGVLGGALFANWDKIFKEIDSSKSPPIPQPLPRPPAPPDSSNAIIAVNNTAQPDGAGRWDWTVFLDTDSNTLSMIRCVEYTLHPTFPDPIREICDPSNGFALKSNGWGEFEIKIKVKFKDESTKNLRYILRFD